MALKDWKKVFDDGGVIIRHKSADPYYPAIHIYTMDGGWEINYTTRKSIKVIKNNIKTKAQALKIAKDYMRSH